VPATAKLGDAAAAAVESIVGALANALVLAALPEQAISVVDKTNIAVVAFGILMGSSWPSESRMSPDGDISIRQ
jgi:hypothetical protein